MTTRAETTPNATRADKLLAKTEVCVIYFSLAESQLDFRPIKEGEPLGDPSGQMRDGEFAYLNRL